MNAHRSHFWTCCAIAYDAMTAHRVIKSATVQSIFKCNANHDVKNLYPTHIFSKIWNKIKFSTLQVCVKVWSMLYRAVTRYMGSHSVGLQNWNGVAHYKIPQKSAKLRYEWALWTIIWLRKVLSYFSCCWPSSTKQMVFWSTAMIMSARILLEDSWNLLYKNLKANLQCNHARNVDLTLTLLPVSKHGP